MDIWHYKRLSAIQLEARTVRAGFLLAVLAACAGCASPGPPLPPSLKLPEVVAATALTATRVGDTVALHWTTPTLTTDKLLITGAVTAVICRDPPVAAPVKSDRSTSKAPPCTEVQRLPVTAGPSDATDPLPAPLTTGPTRELAYRVELLNAAGRTAGPSAAVFAAAGKAPPPVHDFHATATKAGVVLEWDRESAATQASSAGTATVELTRTTLQAPAAAGATAGTAAGPAAATQRKGPTGLPGTEKGPKVVHFEAGDIDAGGTVDRTARIGYTYSYTAQRVRHASDGSRTIEMYSGPVTAVTVEVRDIFPPEVPTGLVVVPGFVNPSDQSSPGTPGIAGESAARHAAIDLSWEPDVEPRVAGYRVYRREGSSGEWRRLTANLARTATYRDATVVAGHTYSYRVTAVSEAGNESAPSTEASETAPAQ